MPDQLVALRLDTEDYELLVACSAKDKLTKSDILRRALRMYADHLGVTVEPKKGRAKKKR
jgi:hypothetical protein